MNKDSLKFRKKIALILEELHFDFDNKITEDYLRKKYGDTTYHAFSRFCFGGNNSYAANITATKQYIMITQKGIEYLFQLKKDMQQDKYNNSILAFASITAVIAALSLITTLYTSYLVKIVAIVTLIFFCGFLYYFSIKNK